MATPATQNATQTAQSADRFKKIETQRYMFNVTKCWEEIAANKRLPLVGFLIRFEQMPPIERGNEKKDWQAAVIKITEPCHALDREQNVVSLNIGAEVLIPGTHQIMQFLAKAAAHPTHVFEVMISPDKKVPIGKGQSMWTYSMGANPKPIARASLGVAGLLESGSATPALPQTAGLSDADVSADIPF